MKFNNTLFLTTALSGVIFSLPAFAEQITGSYLGYYSLTMNAHKDNYIGNVPWPEKTLLGEMNGNKYKILGSSIKDGVWRWDFDNNTVTIGGSTLFAMDMLYVPFQAFNRAEIENKRLDETVSISSMDEVTLPLSYDEKTDLYSIEYAQKMYVVPPMKVEGVADYPIGEAVTSFQVVKNGDDTISISTADIEVDIEPDNVPGTRLADVFPAVVQIEYNAPKMTLELLKDSNEDGISDAMAKLLYLDPFKADTDGDNLNDIIEAPVYVRGVDSDGDGLSDAHEAGDDANNANILSGLPLQRFNKVSISPTSIDSNSTGISNSFVKPLDISISLAHTLVGEYPPETNEQGATLNYQLGNVGFMFNNPSLATELSFNMKFAKQPADLEIYRIKREVNYASSSSEQSFIKVAWTQVNPNEISLAIPSTPWFPNDNIEFIFATTEDLKDTSDKPTDAPKKSGGSLGYWSLLVCGLLTLSRRMTKA